MNFKVSAAIAAAIAFALALAWMLTTKQSNSEVKTVSSHAADFQLGQRSQASAPAAASEAALVKQVAKAHPFPAIPRSRIGMPLDNDPFVAESIEEQRWLDRNGYPNAEQWRIYSTASDLALQQAAAAGDQVALVMLENRALMRGDKDAADRMFKAAAGGSSFALSLLAGYMAASPGGDPILGYAVSRVQEMKGDKRAAIGREMIFRAPLSPEARVRGEADALRLFDSLRRSSTKQPFVDPRPFN